MAPCLPSRVTDLGEHEQGATSNTLHFYSTMTTPEWEECLSTLRSYAERIVDECGSMLSSCADTRYAWILTRIWRHCGMLDSN